MTLKSLICISMLAVGGIAPVLAGEEQGPFIRYIGKGGADKPHTLVCEIHNPTDTPVRYLSPESKGGDACFHLAFADSQGRVECSLAGRLYHPVLNEAEVLTVLAHGVEKVWLPVNPVVWGMLEAAQGKIGIEHRPDADRLVKSDGKGEWVPVPYPAEVQEAADTVIPMEDANAFAEEMDKRPWARLGVLAGPGECREWTWKVKACSDGCLEVGANEDLGEFDWDFHFKLERKPGGHGYHTVYDSRGEDKVGPTAFETVDGSLLLLETLDADGTYNIFLRSEDGANYRKTATLTAYKPLQSISREGDTLILHATDGSECRIPLGCATRD